MNSHLRPAASGRAWAPVGLPLRAGLGFKPQHFEALLGDPDSPGFVEVHAENYMGAGGLAHAQLTRVRERMPVSLHGVGLSIGAASAPDPDHLARLAALVARYQPACFSEHLAWSTHDGRFFNDLLPLCYDNASLDRVCNHVDAVQEALGLRMLIENPASYFEYRDSTMTEPYFIAQVVARTGCRLLLDVNNLYVGCRNNDHDPEHYLQALPLAAVEEIHLAGHFNDVDESGREVLVDNHGSPVCDAVWALYCRVLARAGPIATLIEWDTDVPDYARLRAEARHADARLHDAGVAAKASAA
ncbi:MAG: MNIO family bufferin maturase [Arenimonas sp.]